MSTTFLQKNLNNRLLKVIIDSKKIILVVGSTKKQEVT